MGADMTPVHNAQDAKKIEIVIASVDSDPESVNNQ